MGDRPAYLAQLLAVGQSNPVDIKWVQELRDRAAAHIPELAIPSRRDEEWRFTDLSVLLQVTFSAPNPDILKGQALREQLFPLIVPEAETQRLVFVNGVFSSDLSNLNGIPDGLVVGNLKTLPPQLLERLPDYLGHQPGAEEVFTTLNTASLQDCAVLWVAPSQTIEVPIHLLFLSLSEGTPILSQTRCLVVAESGSHLTLVEDYGTLGENCAYGSHNGTYFTNAVTEIWIAPNAQVNHTYLQRQSGSAFHIAKTAVSQGRDSHYSCYAINLGAKLSRHNLEVWQRNEQTETRLNGLTLIKDEQVADTHSAIAFSHPHGNSQQLHKCLVEDKAHAVFNGKVSVPQAAQMTNASQLNRNLLLSPKARVDTKPQLEITADNVKCTHGATVSQLDPEETFYLQSRGLDRVSAQNLLMDAFAAEILHNLPVRSLRDTLTRCVACRTDLFAP